MNRNRSVTRTKSATGKNGWAYESNYVSGLRVVDVSSVAKDPMGGAFAEVVFFDGASSL